MTYDEMKELARGNVERNLGDAIAEDCDDGEPSADLIYDEAFTLAVDALIDAGVDNKTAGIIATEIAQSFAQP
jgi:hypothetical protein